MDALDWAGGRKKKWSPVDRMLAERRHNRVLVRAPPVVLSESKKSICTQTVDIKQPCTENHCIREKDNLQLEIKDLKKRVRELKRKLGEKHVITVPAKEAIVAPPPRERTPVQPDTSSEELAQTQRRIEDLLKENTKLKASLQHAWARSQQTECLQREIADLKNALEQDKKLLSEKDRLIKEQERQLKARYFDGDKDAYLKALESDQNELVRRVNVLQRKILPSLEVARACVSPRAS